MVKLLVRTRASQEKAIWTEPGISLMEALKRAGANEVVGLCGGVVRARLATSISNLRSLTSYCQPCPAKKTYSICLSIGPQHRDCPVKSWSTSSLK